MSLIHSELGAESPEPNQKAGYAPSGGTALISELGCGFGTR